MKKKRLLTGAVFLILLNSLMISWLIPWIQSIGVGAQGMCADLCYAYALVITAFVPVSVSMKGWIAILAGVLFLVYGIYSARVLKVKTYQIPLMEQDMNLVLLSDLHIGAVGSESRISKIVDQINLLKPDIVCISGAGTWGMPLRIGTSNEIVGITLGTANSVG